MAPVHLADERQGIQVGDRRPVWVVVHGAIVPPVAHAGDRSQALSARYGPGHVAHGIVILAPGDRIQCRAHLQALGRQRRHVGTDHEHKGAWHPAFDGLGHGDVVVDAGCARLEHHQLWLLVVGQAEQASQVEAGRRRIDQFHREPLPFQHAGRIGQPERIVEHTALDHSWATLRARIARVKWWVQNQYIHLCHPMRMLA